MTQQQKSADTFDILLDLKNILCKETLKPKRLHAMIPLIMFKKLTLYGATVWRAGAFTRELSGKHTKALPSPFLSFCPSPCLFLSPLFSAVENWDKFPLTSPVQILIHSVAQCWITGLYHCAHFLLWLLWWEEISHCPGWPPSPKSTFLTATLHILGQVTTQLYTFLTCYLFYIQIENVLYQQKNYVPLKDI